MSSAAAVFAAGSEFRQDTLKTLWPELHDALAGAGPAGPIRRVRCAICSPQHDRAATGRLTRNGHPACPTCLAAAGLAGHPLERSSS